MRPFLLFHLGGLGVQLSRHQPQALGAGEVETGSRDPEAVFGLAMEEFGSEHGSAGSELKKGSPVRRKCNDETLVPGSGRVLLIIESR